MSDSLKQIEEVMNLERTDQLFDATIKSANALSGNPFTKESVKEMSVVVSSGKLHVSTANAKLNAVKMVGYINGIRSTKNAVDRRIRSIRRKQS